MTATPTTFESLQLIDPIVRAVHAEGYHTPTPIQVQAIPHVLTGKDLLGCAQTGTGKTAAFALPILQRLHGSPRQRDHRPIRVLVLTPTRELASQIGESFGTYGRNLGFKNTVIFGGVGQGAQEKALNAGMDILIATPGRLLDLMGQGLVDLKQIQVFVLDEADRMLDMGFIHDVKRIIAALPTRRQTLMFSATMPAEIRGLADGILRDPARVSVTPPATTVELIDQQVYFVEKAGKRALLIDLLSTPEFTRALVFTRTKHGANRVAEWLEKAGIAAEAIHGNKSQNARERALEAFKKGTVAVLVATDIAARGIDIEDISHVVQFDLPNIPETYVHRIGRTARAGASGIAIAFCDQEERAFLRDIEKLTRQRIPVAQGAPPRATGRAAHAPATEGGQPSWMQREDRPRSTTQGPGESPYSRPQQGAPRPAQGPRRHGSGSRPAGGAGSRPSAGGNRGRRGGSRGGGGRR